jgi:hypothetical protein
MGMGSVFGLAIGGQFPEWSFCRAQLLKPACSRAFAI